MKVLVACEYSGVVRDAFLERGHDAWSCDILPTDNPGPHFQCSVEDILDRDWDLMVAHPPCTYLAVSGNRWYADRPDLYLPAVDFVLRLSNSGIPKICIENPVGRLSTLWRPPDQYIQPWQYGHPETKKTGLWLQNLDKLQPSNIVSGREQRIWKMGPSSTRGKDRSKTYQGIALAMADQWG